MVPDCGLALIERFEGLGDGDERAPGLQPYLCPAGYWTLGWGAIHDASGRRVTRATPAIDADEATRLLGRDAIAAAEAAVRLSLPRALADHQLGALVSFIYNLGAGAYQASTLRRRVRTGDDDAASEEFLRWVHARGRVLPGLIRRRAAEKRLWLAAMP
jgi:lysozyme